jgi:hypothetical protein
MNANAQLPPGLKKMPDLVNLNAVFVKILANWGIIRKQSNES